ncbi:hypothetical protein WHR41_09101 [Cladosporium halotolerans]|uniref:Metal homeostatis protein bsd2 n=1 Tax=Cladosporium halotolerans TaxID=1052096 RepID=A0AB34KB52_9PEZI
MSSQRYERIAAQDADDDHDTHNAINNSPTPIPDSPPPSFRSRASSRRPSQSDAQNRSEQERDLHDAFDAPSDDDSDDEQGADQRRLIHRTPSRSSSSGSEASASQPQHPPRRPEEPQRTVTQIPVYIPTPGGRVYGGGNASDGVWANLNAKPRAGEDVEEKPPTYEQAAADATPPYWETTVLSPFSTTGDPNDVFVDGLLVGSFFSFIWNALISMSFQLIGFLLTYLLHTTHAAKHGSRAGLGITLVQYGFQMRYAASGGVSEPGPPNVPADGVPDHPNSHDFDPNNVSGSGGDGPSTAITTADWLSYVLMIVGWFILIRAASDFMRARRQEALVRSSPDRGLGVAVVAEGESPERSV